MRHKVKKARQQLWGPLLIGLALCLALPVTVRAEDTAAVVADMAELKAWLDDNPKGGTVTLGGGIQITEPVRLYLCRVEAESALELPAWVTLDTCIVSPSISGGTVISRKISSVTPPSSFLFAVGEQTTGYFDNNSVFCTLTLSADGVEDEDERAYILFNDSRVDYNKPGEYLLPGILEPPYDDLYAFDIVTEACPIAITITVYDPVIPYFYNYYKARGGVFVISYYYSGDFDALTLWRSDDDGESWRGYWKPGDGDSRKFRVDHDARSLDLLFLDPTELAAPALFVFEVGQGVGSDILYVDAAAVENMGHGGDRDSGDRILLPWEVVLGKPAENGNKNIPPNAANEYPDPEDETGNQGSDGSGGSDGSDGNDTNGGSGNNNGGGDSNGKTNSGQNHGRTQPVQDNSGGDNGNEGDTTPNTQPPPQQKATVIPVALPVPPAAAAAITAIVPLNPPLAEETAPLESPSENQPPVTTATAAADSSVTVPGAPGEPQPEPQPALEPAPPPQPTPQPMPQPMPQPQVIPSSPTNSPTPIFPAWAAGLMGMGGMGGAGYALHKRRRGR